MYRILPGGRRKSHHSIRIRSRSWGQRSERPRKGGRRALANGRRGLSPLGALHRRNDSPMSGTESESESREPARAEKRLPEGRGDSPERGGTVEDAVACRDRNGEGTAGRSLFAERDVGSAEARADALRDARAHCSGNEAMGVEEEQTAPALPPSPGFLRWFNFF